MYIYICTCMYRVYIYIISSWCVCIYIYLYITRVLLNSYVKRASQPQILRWSITRSPRHPGTSFIMDKFLHLEHHSGARRIKHLRTTVGHHLNQPPQHLISQQIRPPTHPLFVPQKVRLWIAVVDAEFPRAVMERGLLPAGPTQSATAWQLRKHKKQKKKWFGGWTNPFEEY